MEKKLIIKGHDNNPFVKFWNWGFNIYYKNTELWNYLIVGGLTTVVALGSKFILLFTVLNAKDPIELQVSEILSWICAVLFAYITNRIFVFKSKSMGIDIINEIMKFTSGRVFTQVIQMFIMWFFVSYLLLNSNILVIVFSLICQIMQIVLNYIISKLLVFKK